MITVIAVTSCRHGQGGLTAGSDADSINWEDSATTLCNQAVTYSNHYQTDSLELFVPEAMKVCLEHNKMGQYYYIWGLLAEKYIWDNNLEKGLDVAKEIQDDAVSRNNAIGLFKSYKLLGIAYGCNNNYEEAVRYLRKAINTFPKGEGMTDLMNTYAYLNMALECTDQKEVIDTVMTEWKAVLDQKPPVQGDKDFLAVVSWHFHYHMTLAKHLLEKKQLKAATAELDSAEYYKKIDSDSQEGADQLTIFPRDTHAAQHPLRLHTGHHNTRHGDR